MQQLLTPLPKAHLRRLRQIHPEIRTVSSKHHHLGKYHIFARYNLASFNVNVSTLTRESSADHGNIVRVGDRTATTRRPKDLGCLNRSSPELVSVFLPEAPVLGLGCIRCLSGFTCKQARRVQADLFSLASQPSHSVAHIYPHLCPS